MIIIVFIRKSPGREVTDHCTGKRWAGAGSMSQLRCTAIDRCCLYVDMFRSDNSITRKHLNIEL